LNPGGNLGGTFVQDITKGFNINSTYFFSKYAGLTLDGGGHFSDQNDVGTIQVGPTFRFQNMNGVTPFVHGLVGLHELGLTGFGSDSGIGTTVGGGLDFATKWPHISVRLIQADWQWAHHNFGFGKSMVENGARLGTGVVFNLGNFGPPPAPPTAACSADPAEVFAGEPVTINVTSQNFNPKHKLSYQWSSNVLKVSGAETTAKVDTTGLQPGSYPVSVTVSDKKLTAQCSANVVIKQPRPPQITCSANPTSVQPGQSSTITCQGSSPDNRPLKYSHQASAGQAQGEDATVTLSTEGVQPGSTVTVNSTVTDDRNLSASTSTTVNVEAPPPPPKAPEAEKINTINFKNNSARVDNAAKAILDDVALRLQRDADAKAVIDGNVQGKESKKLAAQRAINAKAYLVKEKGIDPSRIELRTGSEPGTTADIWIVPAGATFNEQGTMPVTEPAPRKAPAKKK
jgi:outer membrane protein OmpA-like peptidoglycan-associated protein